MLEMTAGRKLVDPHQVSLVVHQRIGALFAACNRKGREAHRVGS